jgi:hypothetical protein
MAHKSRGLRRFDDLRVSWLDLKLGFRMLVRYPGLTRRRRAGHRLWDRERRRSRSRS